MSGRLEGTFQIHDEWVVDPLQNILLTFHMFNLLKLDYLTFLETFEGQGQGFGRIITMLNEAHTAERTGTKG